MYDSDDDNDVDHNNYSSDDDEREVENDDDDDYFCKHEYSTNQHLRKQHQYHHTQQFMLMARTNIQSLP